MLWRRIISMMLLSGALSLQAADSLKIVSWNIFMVPPVVFKSCQQERAGHIAAYLKAQQADVIVLQEAFMKDINQQLLECLQSDFPYQTTPTKKGWIKSNSGVWILSKYPILKQDFILYKHRKGTDIFSKKGAVFAELHTGKNTLQLIATHTQSLGKFRHVREKQLQQLKTQLADVYYRDSIPQVIIGDLNVDFYDTSAYSALTQILDVDDIRYTGSTHSWDGINNQLAAKYFEKIQETLDYILLRKTPENKATLLPVKIDTPVQKDCFCKASFNDLSDHYPLSTMLHFHTP